MSASVSIKGGGDSSNGDWKVVTPPDAMALTNSPSYRQSADGKAITDFFPESCLFVLDLPFSTSQGHVALG
jgi:hypothetical protein